METAAAAAVAALPDDVLAAILGGLPARSLATSRCVCKPWRDLVDGRRLLLPDLLPHAVRGLFVNYIDHFRPHFFARPTSPSWPCSPNIDGEFAIIERENPHPWFSVLDHCNGLVLLSGDHFGDSAMHVCNPTTRRWARLPPRSDHRHWARRAALVVDLAASPHWEVLLQPIEPDKERERQRRPDEDELPDGRLFSEDDGVGWRLMEWPPQPWIWHVLSSRTMRWEERVFAREGEAAGTVTDLLLQEVPEFYEPRWRYAAYWQGALYLHCRGEYVSRLSLSDDKYQVIKSPIHIAECKGGVRSFVGRSEYGVYFAALDDMANLRVWILNESPERTD
ncbi:hypothetical protein ACP70R_008063 [Stipagrostis hirtigluma subsp. patula]